MKTLWLAACAAGALALAALLIGPHVIDWDAYRGSIAAELSRVTGRSISLDGPIEATFLPSPRILANNVRLGTAKTGENGSGDLLRLRAVEIQVGLLPLLTGRVVVERLTLVRPEILVDTDETGRVSWLMDGAGGDLPPDVALQRFAISDGTLVWRDRARGLQTRIENISLRMAADSLTGPARAEGGASVGGVPVRFTLNVGRMTASSPVPLNVSLEATGLRAKSEFVGQYLPAERRLAGRLKASGSDARAVLATLLGSGAGEGAAAALIAHPFGFESRVSAGARSIDASDVVLEIADQRATGAIRARLPEQPSDRTSIEANFSIPRLDLDSLATVPPLSGPPTAAASVDLPRNLRVDLAVNANAVLAAGRAMQGFAVKTSLADGKIDVERLEGQLPGAGSFAISGAVSGPDRSGPVDGNVPQEGLRFLGTIRAGAANLRDLLSWLQVDAGTVPSGRLARAQLTAQLAADAQHATLSNIDLHVDATQAHGDAAIDYRGTPTVTLDLAADHLDLDAYLSDAAEATAATSSSAADTPTLASLPPSPTPSALSALAGNGHFAIAHLTYRGMDLRNVDLGAKISNGEFAIDSFSGAPPEPEQAFAPDPPDAGSEQTQTSPAPVATPTQAAPATAPSPSAETASPASAPSAAPAPVQQVDDRDNFVRGILRGIGR